MSDWMHLRDLRPGSVFETRGGIRAVKSEYRYPNDNFDCTLLRSGEAAHFGVQHNDTEVREIIVADGAPAADAMAIQRAVSRLRTAERKSAKEAATHASAGRAMYCDGTAHGLREALRILEEELAR